MKRRLGAERREKGNEEHRRQRQAQAKPVLHVTWTDLEPGTGVVILK
jgi:hypothetical protein